MNRPGPLLALTLVVTVLVGLVSSGCVPPRPDAADWRKQAATALETGVSELETAALVLRQEARGRLLSGAAVVVVSQAEKNLDSVVSSLSAQQPPAGEPYERVGTALEDAADALTQARIELVRGRAAGLDEHAETLGEHSVRLQRLAGELR